MYLYDSDFSLSQSILYWTQDADNQLTNIKKKEKQDKFSNEAFKQEVGDETTRVDAPNRSQEACVRVKKEENNNKKHRHYD